MNTTVVPTVIGNTNPAPQSSPTPNITNPPSLVYASFGRRLAAYLVDAIITNVVISPLYFFLDMNLVNILFLVLYTFYYVFMVGKYGATLGKMVLKIKIVK